MTSRPSQGAQSDGAMTLASLLTGFHRIRQPGESISVMIVLEDGQIGLGIAQRCSIPAPRARPLSWRQFHFLIEQDVAFIWWPAADSFKRLAKEIEELKDHSGRRLHTAIRWRVPAILDAVAKAKGLNMCDQITGVQYQVSTRMLPILPSPAMTATTMLTG